MSDRSVFSTERRKKANQKSLLNNKPLGYRMLIPASLLILLISIYPLINGIVLGFQQYNLLKPKRRGFIWFNNFVKLSGDSEFFQAITFTFIYTISVVLIAYCLGLMLALLLNRNIRFRGMFRALILIPWIIPPVVAATNWALLLNDQIGFVNNLLRKIGLIENSVLFLAAPDTARITVIITSAWKSFPFMMITLLAGLQAIPGELYEAAEIDGASAGQRFLHITMPMLNSVTVVCTTLMFIWTFNNMENIYLLTRGGPNQATFVLSILTYYTAFMRSDIGYASAMATVLLVILLVMSLIYTRLLNKSNKMEY
ncbi:MAG: carbohydrate ABC transporter permease [Christensenellales bacterium]